MGNFANRGGRSGYGAPSRGNEPLSASHAKGLLANLKRTIGSQSVGKLLQQIQSSGARVRDVPGNIEIRPPGDHYETESDRMAAEALRRPDSPEPADPSAKFLEGSRHHAAGSVLGRSGEPLTDSVRSFYETRFGHDFSKVRVHADSRSARSASAMGASAYAAGQDIVFGAGRFAPDTEQGRQLLAHELAHVVQQDRGQVAPSIQRRLIVTGDAVDAETFIKILQPGSGLTLHWDKKTGEISVKAQSSKPGSPALANELLTIIDDKNQDAEIHVVQKDPPGLSIEFGAFPTDATDYDKGDGKALVQQVRIDEIMALEKGVRGAGAYTLSHEIWENYSAHSAKELETDKKLKGQQREAMHNERVHPLAEAQANLVAKELIGPGERKAMFQVPIDVGKPPKQILRHIEDMKQYFLVWDTEFGGDKMSNVHKAGRTRVSSYTIDGFDDSINLPGSANDIIAKIAGDLKKNPTATAFFEGFASVKKTPEENRKLALTRVLIVEEMVFQKANQSDIVSHYRFFEDGNDSAKRDSIVITIDRPGS